MKLQERVVVITGASAGVGRATAHAFARQGARVALLARDNMALQQVAQEVNAFGGQTMTIAVDMADYDAVENAAQKIEAQWQRIDVWVNNAMATIFSPVEKIVPEDFKRATEVTYLGYVWGTLAALKRMRLRNRGVIVQVGSALAYRAIPLQSPYCGAKYAIRGFTDSVRCELLHEHSAVHVCMVQMPALNTPQFDWSKNNMANKAQPVPPIFQPEVAADAIVWAAQHRRREVIVGASSLKAIWANKFIPGLLDRYLARFGYTSQQADEAVLTPESNLYDTAPDHRTHGRFDKQAKNRSIQFQLTYRYGRVFAAVVASCAAYHAWRLIERRYGANLKKIVAIEKPSAMDGLTRRLPKA